MKINRTKSSKSPRERINLTGIGATPKDNRNESSTEKTM